MCDVAGVQGGSPSKLEVLKRSGFPPTKQCEDISQEKSQEEYRLDQDETRTLKIATRDGYLVDAVVQTVNASKS